MAARKKKASKKRKRTSRKTPAGRGPLAPRIAIAFLRVFVGAIFVDAVQYKLFAQGLPLADAIDQFVALQYVPRLQEAVADPPTFFGTPMTFYATFLDHVMLADGWKTFFAAFILFFEGLMGVALVLGACTRLFAVLGAVLTANFALMWRHYFLTGVNSQWILTVVLVVLAVLAAGRFFGVDARLQHRLPRWVA